MEKENSIISLDLRINGKLDLKYHDEFDQIAHLIRAEFNDFIFRISDPHKENLDWWVETPSSRNPFVSNLFHYCCFLELLSSIIGRNEIINSIFVDSIDYRNVITLYLKENNITSIPVIVVSTPLKGRFKMFFKPYYIVVMVIIKYLIFQSLALMTALYKLKIPNNLPLTLIDTFVFPGFIDEDRTYPGLWDAIDQKKRGSVFFVPNLYGFPVLSLFRTYRKLRKAKRNFLLKEDFFRLSDYLYAFNHLWRKQKIKIGNSYYKKFELSGLIKRELFSNNGFSSAVLAILNYRFALRLKKKNILLHRVINRFENQTIDKGWNAGFLKFYPDADIIGYQGFVASPHYLCAYPTEFEHKCRLLPKTIALMGQRHIFEKREFFPQLRSVNAPALRYKWLWKKRCIFPSGNKFVVLVTLPILTQEFIRIMNMVDSISKEENNEIEFIIKPHPALSPKYIEKQLSFKAIDKYLFSSDTFEIAIENSHLLIGNSSSTSLETLARGIPVIVIGNSHGLTYNPIPKEISRKIWKLCYSKEELVGAINYFRNNSTNFKKLFKTTGEQIRNDYFARVTPSSIRKLLGSE
jgi:hypothetical protein